MLQYDFYGINYTEAKLSVEFCANVYGPLDTEMVILQLYSLKVFTQRNFIAETL